MTLKPVNTCHQNTKVLKVYHGNNVIIISAVEFFLFFKAPKML